MEKLLIVEDNGDIRQALVESIPWERKGIEVIAAVENGELALQYLSDDIAVVITDVVMSKMDGMQLAKFVQQNHPMTKIIFISAHAEFQYAKSALRFGAYDYVSKPIDNTYLLDTVLSAINDRKNEFLLRERVRKSIPLFRERLLVDIVMGEVLLDTVTADCAYLGLDFHSMYHQCILFEPKRDLAPNEGAEETRMLEYMLMEQIRNIFPAFRNMVFSGLGGIVALLYGRDELPPKNESTLYDCLGNLLSAVKEHLAASLTIGIGVPVTDVQEISRSYKSARDALDSKFFLGYGRLYSYSDAASKNESSPDVYGLQSYKERFITAVKFDHAETLDGMLNELSDSAGRLVYGKEQVKLLFYTLGAELAMLTEEFGVNEDLKGNVSGQFTNMLNQLQILDTKDEMIHVFKRYVVWLKSMILELRNSKSNSTIAFILDCIHRNFADPAINVNKLAGEVYMSPGYIGAVFKKAMGKSISEYIMEIRINAAKNLLLQSDQKVYEVSYKVGFESPFYFSACFKKVTGNSPNDYKNVMSTFPCQDTLKREK